MELLDEYQQALKKIQELEAKLKDYENAVDTVDHGLSALIDSFKDEIKQAYAHADNEKKRAIVDEMFGVPMRVLELNRILLSIPKLDKAAQDEARQRSSKIAVELLKEKMVRMTKFKE